MFKQAFTRKSGKPYLQSPQTNNCLLKMIWESLKAVCILRRPSQSIIFGKNDEILPSLISFQLWVNYANLMNYVFLCLILKIDFNLLTIEKNLKVKGSIHGLLNKPWVNPTIGFHMQILIILFLFFTWIKKTCFRKQHERMQLLRIKQVRIHLSA